MLPAQFHYMLRFAILISLVHALCVAQPAETSLTLISDANNITLDRGTVIAFSTAPLAPPAPEDIVVPPGRVLYGELRHRVKGQSSKSGDAVEMALLYPIEFNSSDRVTRVPQRAAIKGHITEVSRREGRQRSARLALVADVVMWGDSHAHLRGNVVGVSLPGSGGRRPPEPDQAGLFPARDAPRPGSMQRR